MFCSLRKQLLLLTALLSVIKFCAFRALWAPERPFSLSRGSRFEFLFVQCFVYVPMFLLTPIVHEDFLFICAPVLHEDGRVQVRVVLPLPPSEGSVCALPHLCPQPDGSAPQAGEPFSCATILSVLHALSTLYLSFRLHR